MSASKDLTSILFGSQSRGSSAVAELFPFAAKLEGQFRLVSLWGTSSGSNSSGGGYTCSVLVESEPPFSCEVPREGLTVQPGCILCSLISPRYGRLSVFLYHTMSADSEKGESGRVPSSLSAPLSQDHHPIAARHRCGEGGRSIVFVFQMQRNT